jgi:hypothetical protein
VPIFSLHLLAQHFGCVLLHIDRRQISCPNHRRTEVFRSWLSTAYHDIRAGCFNLFLAAFTICIVYQYSDIDILIYLDIVILAASMGRMLISLTDLLEFEFRETALKRFRKGRGILSLAAEEAIGEWIQKQRKLGK